MAKGHLDGTSVFFSTAPAATFLWQDKEKWGPDSCGKPAFPGEPPEKAEVQPHDKRGRNGAPF
jgi:hypothetical protein